MSTKRNQIEQSKMIKEKFSNFLKSIFSIKDIEYNNLYHKKLEEIESKLYKGPFLSSELPFETGESINQLIDIGLFDKDFKKIDSLDFDRPCYKHQVNAFRQIKAKNNVVVTTGTGSGKTECFMLPIIDELIKEVRNNSKPGIRAIFLFPLNALVYDQIERLRAFLKSYEDLKFGFYVGKTPETNKTIAGKKEVKKYIEQFGEPIANEIITREEMRQNPPQILFTNYSMLEYLLIRPKDGNIMSEEALKDMRFIVLDEAHVYKGTLGIEIGMLMRRLLGTARKKSQFILTSATLGRGHEDIDEIIKFANNLTSVKFNKESIIFGERKKNDFTNEYIISNEDYIILNKNIDNADVLRGICEKYCTFKEGSSLELNLYELLIRDVNTAKLFEETKKSEDFYEVLSRMVTLTEEGLSSLINLIMKAKSSDLKYPTKLYDIKYHMFVKAPDGAFVTLGKNKDLSLVVTNQINEKKAFKIGICQNCKMPYIMGITENNILSIDDEIDIDESYEDKSKRLEYYLIEDCLTQDELLKISKSNKFEKYYVCSKCGYIKKAKAPKSTSDCDHFNSNMVVLYRYKTKDEINDDIIINNIHKCPICEYTSSQHGVVMGFHVGKDRATGLIAQILYDAMNYPEIKLQPQLTFFKKAETKKGKKQFLTFSDSRQQAAFFSKFLNSVNNNILKKVLLLKLLEENNYEKIGFDELILKIINIYSNQFEYNSIEATKYAIVASLWELLLVDGRNSGEGIGLFAFVLDSINEKFGQDNELEAFLKENYFGDITAQQFRDAFAQVFSVFRTSPAIKYPQFVVDDNEELKELLGYRNRNVFITLKDTVITDEDDYKRAVKSFLPKNGNSNNIVKYIQKCFGYDFEKSISLLEMMFRLAIDGGIIKKNNELHTIQDVDTYYIESSDYSLYSYKKLKYYRCKKCHKLTIYNVNNKCTDGSCDGELVECDISNDALVKNNYYRNEYLERDIEDLKCEEHTAQLNAGEARDFQKKFKDGKINFISSSTTFEMGIDLGGLDTVFMRNVPPLPSNYAQRAGRAGRRAETSAFILTFCGTSSHDYTYFINPKEMIKGKVRPPYFVLDNEKIIIRHILATAISCYFKSEQNGDELLTVENFIANNIKDEIIQYIKNKPKTLGEIIDNYLLSTDELKEKYSNYKWLKLIDIAESTLNLMHEGLVSTKETLEEAKNVAVQLKEYKLIDMYDAQLKSFKSPNSLISYLSKYNVIPSYGFPIDNVELKIFNKFINDMDETYNLSRNLSLAISEYAPGSEVIVDGKKYTSRYLYTPNVKNKLPKVYYCECDKCHTINTNPIENYFISGNKCVYCGSQITKSKGEIKNYIIPKYGFVADSKNKDSVRIKPFKTYASDYYHIGAGIENDMKNNYVSEIKNEELLVMNENKFFYCPDCGYTDLDKKCMSAIKNSEHKMFNGKKCNNKKLDLIALGYTYKTDIIKLNFMNISELNNEEAAISVLYAILEGVSRSLDVDREDINGILKQDAKKHFSFLLFDTVPGGAGYVKRLTEKEVLVSVLNNALLKVSQDCCDSQTSCYNCLRTYNNQKIHKKLKRGVAKEVLEKIIIEVQSQSKEFTIGNARMNLSLDEIINRTSDEITKTKLLILKKGILEEGSVLPDQGYSYPIKFIDEPPAYCDIVWRKQKILLFEAKHKNSFDKINSSQNEYKCYLLNEDFNYKTLLKQLEEK